MKIGIIGLGLIGGSIARCLKKNSEKFEIVAFDTNIEQLELAKKDKNIDFYTLNIDESFSKCDLIFICTPVNLTHNIVKKLSQIVDKDCILTDVGSTKLNIMTELSGIKGINFIGGHPMAGSEKSGYINSSDILFENAFYIVTPYESTNQESIEVLKYIIQTLGAIYIELSPQEHDNCVSIVSHIPHLIASALVNFVKENDNERQILKTLCAGGFKDITRIASSDGNLWQSIIMSNKDYVLDNLKDLITEIEKIYEFISKDKNEEIVKYINDGKTFRNSFKNTSSYLKSYDVTVDVADKPNAIGVIATILGDNNINIKNIGINNNREFKGFALNITFENEKTMLSAIEVLKGKNYKIEII